MHNLITVLMTSEESVGESYWKENKCALEWIINIGRYCTVHLIKEEIVEDTGQKRQREDAKKGLTRILGVTGDTADTRCDRGYRRLKCGYRG